ncbi:uncharacterized protein LOC129771352 [Toxorhynchites rutilus septentrionalis]|uniref:uncharacterized protein LOC129771352 n=1 Tax=Toxorhynchites rutilus septentrionalis TaxID=329112 RepID=UPI00247A7DE1|nr:uncharacterized protein LOC129771352 [Toxorhynchites rutilus septentrionalis]
MEGDYIAHTLKVAFYKLFEQHFQNLNELCSCIVFIISVIVLWYVATWIIGTIIRLLLPLFVCVVFLIILNEKYPTALPNLVKLFHNIYSCALNYFEKLTS